MQTQKDDSEEEEYALSENWTFEQKNRRWSRVGEMMADIPPNHFADKSDKSTESRDSSSDKLDTTGPHAYPGFSTLPKGMSYQSSGDPEATAHPVRFRRTGSERLKDGAKALLRRVESIKSRRRKRQNRDGVVISGPQELDLTQISSDAKLTMARSQPPSPLPGSPFKLPGGVSDVKAEFANTNRLSPLNYSMSLSSGGCGQRKMNHSVSNRTSPLHFFNSANIVIDVRSGDESSSYFSDASQESSGGCGSNTSTGGGANIPAKRPSRTRRFLQKGGSKVEDSGAMSDSECPHLMGGLNHAKCLNDSCKKASEVLLKPVAKLTRGGSLNLGKESQGRRDGLKSRSFRSRSSYRKTTDGFGGEEERAAAKAVLRWHSFQSHDRPEFMFKKCFSGVSDRDSGGAADGGMPLAAMSCGQIQVGRIILSC